ncbi:MAG: TIGR02206 family membrane protein [Verrucomicrobiae bacterium]|nr:TIGR02206 family membrane protein [Verrucomicrobiae bacterium]
MERPFAAFGPDHLAVLGVMSILAAGLALMGRRADEKTRASTCAFLGWALVGYAMASHGYRFFHQTWRCLDCLPLQLCDWVLIACIIALFTRNSLASETAYFFGLTGTMQAIITPDLQKGFPSWPFFRFFWGHAGIVLAIVCILAVQRFRPRPGAVWRMFSLINFYAVFVGGLNAVFGWNYGYLCHKPSKASLLDHLGPWPWYILSIEFICLASFLLLCLPWRLRSQQSPRKF